MGLHGIIIILPPAIFCFVLLPSPGLHHLPSTPQAAVTAVGGLVPLVSAILALLSLMSPLLFPCSHTSYPSHEQLLTVVVEGTDCCEGLRVGGCHWCSLWCCSPCRWWLPQLGLLVVPLPHSLPLSSSSLTGSTHNPHRYGGKCSLCRHHHGAGAGADV